MARVSITVTDCEDASFSTSHSFDCSPITIGRGAHNHVGLSGHTFVSTNHAEIRVEGETLVLIDPGSLNGTKVEGSVLPRGSAMRLGQSGRFEIGRLRFDVSLENAPVKATPLSTPAPAQSQAREPEAPVARSFGHTSPVTPATNPPTTNDGPEQAAPAPIAAPPQPQSIPQSAPQSVSPPPIAGRSLNQDAPRTAFVDLGRIHQVLRELAPDFQQMQQAQENWARKVESSLAALPESDRLVARAMVGRHYGSNSAIAAAGNQTGPGLSGMDEKSAQQLAQSLLPADLQPQSSEEQARFIRNTERYCKAAAEALVSLIRGHEQFVRELGVRLSRSYTPLHAAETPESILTFLLDPRTSDASKWQALEQVWTEHEIHPIALINATRAGAQAVLARLHPSEIERQTDASWLTRPAAMWRDYIDRHQALSDDEQQLARVLFGNEFCRAYTAYTESFSHEKA